MVKNGSGDVTVTGHFRVPDLSSIGIIASLRGLSRLKVDALVNIVAATYITAGEPELAPPPASTPTPTPTPGQPYVDLYGHMTDVTVGEEIILYLSVVNPITSPGTLVVQLTLSIPSGWSITSSGFGHGAGGLRTNTYEIEQGPNPQEIDVHILANEPFEGDVIGYMDYYFAEQEETKYRHEARLPVSAKPAQPQPEPAPTPFVPTPWWREPQWLVPVVIASIACIAGIIRLFVMLGRKLIITVTASIAGQTRNILWNNTALPNIYLAFQ